MAKIGVFEEAPQKWFKFDSDTEVLLKHIEKGRINAILLQGAEAAKKMSAKSSDVQDIFLGKEAVFGWRKVDAHKEPGFLLPDGSPLPFTAANRNLLMTKSKRFAEWVFNVCSNDLAYLDEDTPQLEAGDLKGLDELLEELATTGDEDLPGNA